MGALIFLAFIVAVFFTWFFMHKSKEEERKLLIEKGFKPSELPERKSFSFNFRFPWIKIGTLILILAIGGGFGFILATYLDEIGYGQYSGAVFIISLFLFGGIGMITAHYVDKPNKKS